MKLAFGNVTCYVQADQDAIFTAERVSELIQRFDNEKKFVLAQGPNGWKMFPKNKIHISGIHPECGKNLIDLERSIIDYFTNKAQDDVE